MLRCPRLEHDRAGCGRKKSRDQPQQRGLARAIGAFHHQRLARRDREIETREHAPVAARAGELFGGEGRNHARIHIARRDEPD